MAREAEEKKKEVNRLQQEVDRMVSSVVISDYGLLCAVCSLLRAPKSTRSGSPA